MTTETPLRDLMPADPLQEDDLRHVLGEDDARFARLVAGRPPVAPPRRRWPVRLAAVGLAGGLAVAAIAVVMTRDDGPEVAITTGGDSPAASAGLPGMELEVRPRLAFGSREVLDEAEAVLRTRARALGIRGFDVRRVGTSLFVEVPRADSIRPSANLMGSSVLAVWSRSQIVRTGRSAAALLQVARSTRAAGRRPETWYVLSGGPGFLGPYFTAGEAEAAAADPAGRRSLRVVSLPSGLALVRERGVGVHLVGGAPVVTANDATGTAAGPGNAIALRLSDAGAARAAQAVAKGGGMLATVDGSLAAGSALRDGVLLLGPPPATPGPLGGVVRTTGPEAGLRLVDGVGIVFDLVAARPLGPAVPEGGARVSVPGFVRREFRGGSTLRPGAPLVDASTIRLAARARGNRGAFVEIWTGRRAGGPELFVVFQRNPGRTTGYSGALRPQLASGGPWSLGPDSPGLTAGFIGLYSLSAYLFGRAAADVTSVRATAGGREVGRVTPDHGWWVMITVPGTVRGPGLTVDALTAAGDVVATRRIP